MSQLHNHKVLKPIRRQLRHNLTKAEAILWNYLKGSGLGFKFRRQQSIGKYIVDFFCPAVDLVVELDGGIHGEESRRIRDKEMEEFLRNKGFTVARFTNEQLFSNLGHVISEIKNLCVRLSKNKTTPTPPCQGGDWTKPPLRHSLRKEGIYGTTPTPSLGRLGTGSCKGGD